MISKNNKLLPHCLHWGEMQPLLPLGILHGVLRKSAGCSGSAPSQPVPLPMVLKQDNSGLPSCLPHHRAAGVPTRLCHSLTQTLQDSPWLQQGPSICCRFQHPDDFMELFYIKSRAQRGNVSILQNCISHSYPHAWPRVILIEFLEVSKDTRWSSNALLGHVCSSHTAMSCEGCPACQRDKVCTAHSPYTIL